MISQYIVVDLFLGTCEVSCGSPPNATKPDPFKNLNLEFETIGLVITFFLQWIALTG
jgi:hypothetical protein